MLLSENKLNNILAVYQNSLKELYESYSYEDFEDDDFEKEKESLCEEISMIDRVLNGKETIKLADGSVWLYFSNILKIG